jgi:hypothetical protein
MRQKLSEIISKMIEPFHTDDEEPEYIEKLITCAVVAWNMTLLPAKEAKTSFKDIIKKHPGTRKQKGELRSLISYYIKYKLDNHKDDDRLILEHQFGMSNTP